jgi:hypothetical protein
VTSGTVAALSSWGGATGESSDVIIQNCHFQSFGAVGVHSGFRIENDAIEAFVRIENCIIDGLTSENSNSYGMYLYGNTKISNTIIYGSYYGARRIGGIHEARNCAVFNNVNDFHGTWRIIDYCASDDNDGTNNVAESGGGAAWPLDFEDAANGDFTLLTGSNLKNAGTPIRGLTLDIEGDAYHVTTPSLGVDEFVGAGPSALPMIYYQQSS